MAVVQSYTDDSDCNSVFWDKALWPLALLLDNVIFVCWSSLTKGADNSSLLCSWWLLLPWSLTAVRHIHWWLLLWSVGGVWLLVLSASVVGVVGDSASMSWRSESNGHSFSLGWKGYGDVAQHLHLGPSMLPAQGLPHCMWWETLALEFLLMQWSRCHGERCHCWKLSHWMLGKVTVEVEWGLSVLYSPMFCMG